MVHFHRPLTFLLIKTLVPAHPMVYMVHIYLHTVYDVFNIWASDKMSLSVFELLHSPRPQSLVERFGLAGIEVVGAA